MTTIWSPVPTSWSFNQNEWDGSYWRRKNIIIMKLRQYLATFGSSCLNVFFRIWNDVIRLNLIIFVKRKLSFFFSETHVKWVQMAKHIVWTKVIMITLMATIKTKSNKASEQMKEFLAKEWSLFGEDRETKRKKTDFLEIIKRNEDWRRMKE